MKKGTVLVSVQGKTNKELAEEIKRLKIFRNEFKKQADYSGDENNILPNEGPLTYSLIR